MNIGFLGNKNAFNIFQNTSLNFVSFKGAARDTFVRRNVQDSSAKRMRKNDTRIKITSLEKIKTCTPLKDFQYIYNFSDEDVQKIPRFVLSKRNTMGDKINADRKYFTSEFVDKDSTEVRMAINEHNKTTPIIAGKYFKKAGEITPPVPVNALVQLGFGDEDQLKEAVKSGKIKGYIETSQDNPDEEKYFIDINGFREECYLKQMRTENQNIVELSDFALKTGITEQNILNSLKNNELVIIKHFLFETDRDKVFINLANPRNAEYLNRIGYKNTPIV